MDASDTANRADACPVCDPGDPPAAPARTVQPTACGGTLTTHECGYCGTSWRLWRDMYGWPVVRILDPLSPAQAEINRGVLKEAIAEQVRERRSAA
jgi:hypothetical protein